MKKLLMIGFAVVGMASTMLAVKSEKLAESKAPHAKLNKMQKPMKHDMEKFGTKKHGMEKRGVKGMKGKGLAAKNEIAPNGIVSTEPVVVEVAEETIDPFDMSDQEIVELE